MKISEYKQLFLSEAEEILNSLNNVLVNFEKEPTNIALLNELFRQSHTLKSMAQSMEYKGITKLTHSMEATLALLRSGRVKADKDTVNLLFQSLDTLGSLVEVVKRGGVKQVKIAPLVERFEEIASRLMKEEKKPGEEKKSDLRRAEEISSSIPLSEAHTVRVPLADLDSLADMVGELVINRIRLAQIAQAVENNSLAETVAQMSRLISQLQDQMMEVRLVPLDYIFTPYPRMMRDIAISHNKEVDLLIDASGIGLDRSIQDEINEPLLHLLKNAVIHGIEEPKERKRQKKPARGKIKLLARRERDFVVIELSDDGRGIDIEEVKEVAIRGGFISKEELSALTPREVVMLTTYPGYSRTKKVTEVAGRGVGLNAAKAKVESLGGALEIDSKPGEGTTLSIRLPLTMAVLPTMQVGIGDETYCIPLSSIAETIKVSADEVKTMEQHEVISHRDTVLPLIRLGERFGFSSSRTSSLASKVEGRIPTLPVVVVEAGGRKAGLVVDSLLGQQEVVIKPLIGILREIKGVSGATILATGKAALIVDVTSLLSKR